jgi:hypothetical protein
VQGGLLKLAQRTEDREVRLEAEAAAARAAAQKERADAAAAAAAKEKVLELGKLMAFLRTLPCNNAAKRSAYKLAADDVHTTAAMITDVIQRMEFEDEATCATFENELNAQISAAVAVAAAAAAGAVAAAAAAAAAAGASK